MSILDKLNRTLQFRSYKTDLSAGKCSLNITENILLFCNPRGGSTWLMEILSSINNTAIVWEPLFRGKIDTTGKTPTQTRAGLEVLNNLNFWYSEYIAPSEERPDAFKFFNDLFSHKYLHRSIYHKNSIKSLQNADTAIFKFCYANLMTQWLITNYNYKSIILHRHPCAVVSSQLKHKGGWKNHESLDRFSIPKCNNPSLFQKHENILLKLHTTEECLAAIWSLNFLATHEQGDSVLTIHYEDLLLNTRESLELLQKYINKDLDIDNILSVAHLPSKTSNKSKIIPEKQLSSWKNNLSTEQIENILNTVQRFGIDTYNYSLIPDSH